MDIDTETGGSSESPKDWLLEARKNAASGRPDLVLESLTIASWTGREVPIEDRLGLLNEARNNRGANLGTLKSMLDRSEDKSPAARMFSRFLDEERKADLNQSLSLGAHRAQAKRSQP